MREVAVSVNFKRYVGDPAEIVLEPHQGGPRRCRFL
jgi:hypothetical protein